jgi:hypothetical protein
VQHRVGHLAGEETETVRVWGAPAANITNNTFRCSDATSPSRIRWTVMKPLPCYRTHTGCLVDLGGGIELELAELRGRSLVAIWKGRSVFGPVQHVAPSVEDDDDDDDSRSHGEVLYGAVTWPKRFIGQPGVHVLRSINDIISHVFERP